MRDAEQETQREGDEGELHRLNALCTISITNYY